MPDAIGYNDACCDTLKKKRYIADNKYGCMNKYSYLSYDQGGKR